MMCVVNSEEFAHGFHDEFLSNVDECFVSTSAV